MSTTTSDDWYARLLPRPRRWQPESNTAVRVLREHVLRLAPATLTAQEPGVTLEHNGLRYQAYLDAEAVPEAPEAVSHEAYRIEIHAQGVEVHVNSDLAWLHAGRTLRQLLGAESLAGSADSRAALPCCTIVDWPDLPHRGVMLDISRDRVPTMAYLWRWIDELAERKVNQLQLYTEHTFAFAGYEEVWQHASPMTPGEIRDIGSYCFDRGIELVANQNCFGHMERWLKHKPYEHLAETLGEWTTPFGDRRNYPSTLCPGDPGSIALVDDLLGQLTPHFESPWLNIGCDETFELGQGRSKPDCEARGEGRVYTDFLKQVIAAADRRGKRTMFWGDVVLNYPELLGEFAKDAVVLNWGYEITHPFEEECPKFAKAGVPFYICPSTATFLAVIGRPETCVENLKNAMNHGLAHGTSGMLMTIWGDRGHWQASCLDAFGLVMGPAYAWHFDGNRRLDPAEAVSRFALNDPTGHAGQALWRLGEAGPALGLTTIGPLGWTLLVEDAPLVDGLLKFRWMDVGPITKDGLDAAQQAIDDARGLLDQAQPQRGVGQDAKDMLDELGVTLDLASHAVANLRARLTENVKLDGELAEESRTMLAESMSSIIDRFSAQWPRRSRPGGLADSLGPLQRRLAAYRHEGSTASVTANAVGTA